MKVFAIEKLTSKEVSFDPPQFACNDKDEAWCSVKPDFIVMLASELAAMTDNTIAVVEVDTDGLEPYELLDDSGRPVTDSIKLRH
jgi:hypothetical protein